ncbi:MAG: SusF/SusE family outer membrane protein [Phaeodactylibacter sp.]|nr:SusF/SusE family outer membrane protein [Phaeodactylibacter sp.]
MKRTIKILSLLIGLAALVFSCTKEEIDVDALTDFPPGIVSVSPANNSKVVIGNFDIKVEFADGQSSPLATATVSLSDEFAQLASVTKGLSGVRDSLVILGSEFDVPAEQLGPGVYTIDISVTDSKGQETTRQTKFEISLLPFAANNNEMYIAGAFNGWGADEMTLVADYTWEIIVDIQGGEYKLKNTPDWTDEDWGDSNCDGIMEITTGGGPNTPAGCAPTGEARFRFNDQTLAYTISPLVEFETNISGLYLHGTFNDFYGDEYAFSLVADNTWELPEIRLSPGDKYRFSEGPASMGKVWGDAEGDGVAEEFGPNIEFTMSDAIYKVSFNDKTLEYGFEFIRGLFPDQLYLVGGLAAHGAWTPDASIPFMKVADGAFEIFAPLEAGTGFKFLEIQDWPGDWGMDPNNPGSIIQEGEQDATVNESGFYLIRIDFNERSATFTKTDWGLIGSATPTGWDSDTDMTFQNDFEWTITIDLTGGGAIKFRANDDWPINFGDNDTDGSLERGGADIPVGEDGNYTVTMKLYPEGYTYDLIKN